MFKGLGNIGNIASIVGKLQDVPAKIQELNERMKLETVSASSGCGAVNIVMSGTGHVQSVKIDGDLSGQELEHAIQEATNAAGAAAKQLYSESISQMVSDMDLNLPGIDGVLKNLTGGS
jgi:DNA-binding protein YbaB